MILFLSLLLASSPTPVGAPGTTAEPVKVVYAAGYIPNIQFAPFYVAMSRGYYREEGIELEMDYTIGPDVFKLVALNKAQIGSADPDAFLHAVVRNLPLVHVATMYQNYPIALIAKKPIFTREGLTGKRIGISGTYGSSYLGLKAMLAEIGLSLTDAQIVPIGYTQVAALKNDKVDAVVGYINNEPVRLDGLEVKTHTYSLDGTQGLPGVGLMTSRRFATQSASHLKAFLRATFRGMNDVITDPKSCYALVVNEYLPELQGAHYDDEFRILEATLPFWKNGHVNINGYGQCPDTLWKNLADRLVREQGDRKYENWSDHVNRDFTWKP